MIKAKTIDHINMNVKSIEETREFYKEHFSFVTYEDCRPVSNSIIIGNEHIKLCIYEVDDFEIGSGFNHFGIHISNFEETCNYLKKNNIELQYGGIIDWHASKSVYIKDPNGYEIELCQMNGGGLRL